MPFALNVAPVTLAAFVSLTRAALSSFDDQPLSIPRKQFEHFFVHHEVTRHSVNAT
jgi:hypothetical protein